MGGFFLYGKLYGDYFPTNEDHFLTQQSRKVTKVSFWGTKYIIKTKTTTCKKDYSMDKVGTSINMVKIKDYCGVR